MRISDWSSDVCSSDLLLPLGPRIEEVEVGARGKVAKTAAQHDCPAARLLRRGEFGKQHAHQLGSDEIIGPILHGQHGQRAADVALDERGLLALLFRGLAPGCCGLGLCHRLLPSSSLAPPSPGRSEEHTSELQSLMCISYAVFCLKKKNLQYPCM